MRKIIYVIAMIFIISLSSCKGGDDPSSSSKKPSSNSSTIPSISSPIVSSSTKSPTTSSSSINKEEPVELLVNGDFENGGVAPFINSDFEGGASTLEVDNGKLKLDVTAVSWGQASPRLEYNNLSLEDKKIYKLSFDAYVENERAIHMQVGELLAADPWYKSATNDNYFINLTTSSKKYEFTFKIDSSIAGANLDNLSILLEFGKMSNGMTSVITPAYFDNFSLIEVDEEILDSDAPLISVNKKEYFYTEEIFRPMEYVSAIDNKDGNITITIDESSSKVPSVDENDLITSEPGNYKVVFVAEDAAGNKSSETWEFEVKRKIEIIDNFNLVEFRKGNGFQGDDTSIGYVYAANSDTTFEYKNRQLKINSKQNSETNDWTATQVFVRSVRVSGSGSYNLSFDLESSKAGHIQVVTNFCDPVAYEIKEGMNHIVYEKNAFDYNYADLTIVFGTHITLQQPSKNIGEFEATISNFKFVMNTEGVDVTAPFIKLREIKTYFSGDEFIPLNTISVWDYRDKNAKVEIVEEESNIPAVDENNRLTEGGEFYITYQATDASNNSRKFTAYYQVKGIPEGVNNFAIQELIYGEEWMVNDPTIAYLWNENGVNVTREVVSKDAIRFSTDQTSAHPWYATQLFFKSLKVTEFGLYTISYTITSDVAGKIKLDGGLYELKVGDNNISKTISLLPNGFYQGSIQFGKEESGNIGACNIIVKNLSLTMIPKEENPVWSGYNMEVSQSGKDNIITYDNITSPFYESNARIYDFSDKTNYEAMSIEFTGTLGHTYQFKIEGLTSAVYAASSIVGTGEKQKVILKMTNMTYNQKEQLHNILMFVENVGVSGSVTIHGYKFYEDIDDAYETKWRAEGTKVVEDGTKSVISFENVPSAWWGQNAQYGIDEGTILADTTKVIFTFKGEAGVEYLFKIEGFGSHELSCIATGEVQEFTLDFSIIGSQYRPRLSLLVVFCKTVGFTGTIEIYNVEFA